MSRKAAIKSLMVLATLALVGCGQMKEANSEVVDIRTPGEWDSEAELEANYEASAESELPSREIVTGTVEFAMPFIDADFVSTKVALVRSNCEKACNAYSWTLSAQPGDKIRLPNVGGGEYQIVVTIETAGYTVVAKGEVVVVREGVTATRISVPAEDLI